MDDPPGGGGPWARTAAVIALAVLLGGGAGFGVWTLFRDDGTTRTTSTSSSPSTPTPSASAAAPNSDDGGDTDGSDGNTDPATPKSSKSSESSDAASDPDADQYSDQGAAPGYVSSDDPAGFTVDVPSDWDRTAKTPAGKPTVVTYDSPDGTRTLQLFQISEDTPAESMDLAENENYGFARLPGYRVLDRSAADDSFSEVVYRFDGEDGAGPRQVIDHRFRTADGQIYGARLSAPESAPLTDLRETITMATTTLCPTGATCVRG
ncbi:hypothetical protein [Streptomyces phaeolivaceus]|uniref:hypothetical protein n=1 Tax=Streptomyces phaeolivaceus TaxID=2653200 RepID=UPI001D0469DD|nr:hypothetical protein [Streptomyces phaeolivaceus]